MSTAGISANKLELLQIAKAVATEKSIDESIVLEAIEEAIQKAARLRYGAEQDIRAKINPVTGEQSLRRVITVVEDDAIENDTTEVGISAAKLDVSARSSMVSSSVLNMATSLLIWVALKA